MGKLYVSSNEVATLPNKIYYGINGVATEVQKIYYGVNGVAVLIYPNETDTYLSHFTVDTTAVTLTVG